MSTPASAWRGTIALTAARPAAAIVSASMLSARARRTKRPVKSSGRGKLPACVVRIRSELRRMNGPALWRWPAAGAAALKRYAKNFRSGVRFDLFDEVVPHTAGNRSDAERARLVLRGL